MTSLYELTKKLEFGSKIAWQGEMPFGSTNQVTPRTVTKIQYTEDGIQVNADGPGPGKYYYTIDTTGESESVYVNSEEKKSEGSVAFAKRTGSDEPVSVKRGYYDSQ